ncbi:hypothetical protein BTVI_20647 [Pitangus sulphuratus]|nr:hypothetical protein BTVI_20647 [Pitangus sulphuratus]
MKVDEDLDVFCTSTVPQISSSGKAISCHLLAQTNVESPISLPGSRRTQWSVKPSFHSNTLLCFPGNQDPQNRVAIDDRSRASQCPELEDHDYENDQLLTDPETMWDLLLQVDPYKFMGFGGIPPRILKELADVITKPLQRLLSGLGNLQRSQMTGSWRMLPNFQEGQEGGPQKLQVCRSHFSAW